MDTSALIFSAALGIAHPEQYELTRKCLEHVALDPEFSELATRWAFAFHVVTIVANRSTITHRDIRSGGRPLLDILATFGGSENTVIEFPGLGLRLQYDSGTLVLFSGHVHPHGVSVSRDERVCLALYARRAMFHKFGLGLPSCVRLDEMKWFPNTPFA